MKSHLVCQSICLFIIVEIFCPIDAFANPLFFDPDKVEYFEESVGPRNDSAV